MSFKSFDLSQDVASVVSSINEVVSISGSLFAQDANVKFYNNISSSSVKLGGYWQTVFDSDVTSSLSTPILDMTFGYAEGSAYNQPGSSYSSQNEKVKIYRMMASSLLGNPDSLFTINGESVSECFFIMVKRGIQKDELKKGTTSICLYSGSTWLTASDAGASVNFKQTVGGDYSPLYIVNSASKEVGQVWYNAGVLVLNAMNSASANYAFSNSSMWSGSNSMGTLQLSGTIDNLVDGLRDYVDKINFHNQTNLYSTIYFCRATNTEFNYSSNPTFLDENKRIRVTSGSNILQTRTYVTTAGLYDANDNLLAVAKVNKPLTKSPDTELTLRIRLDY